VLQISNSGVSFHVMLDDDFSYT